MDGICQQFYLKCIAVEEQGNRADPQRLSLMKDHTNAPAMESNVDH